MNETGTTRPARRFGMAAVAVACLFATHLLLLFLFADSALRAAISGAMQILIALVSAAVLLYAAALTLRQSRREAAGWALLACGSLGWMAGDIAWFTLGIPAESAMRLAPFHAFYRAWYPLFFAAALCLGNYPREQLRRVRLTLDAGMVICTAALLLWNIGPGPALQRHALQGASLSLISVYAVGEILLLLGIMVLVYAPPPMKRRGTQVLLIAAALAHILTDVIFCRQALAGIDAVGSLLEAGWTGAMALAALAALRRTRALGLSARESPRESSAIVPRLTRGALYMAPAGLAAVILLLLWGNRQPLAMSMNALAVGVVGVIGIVALRQFISAWENDHLYAALRADRDALRGRVLKGEEMLRRMVECANDIVLLHDLNGRCLYFNSPQRYGIATADFIGKTPAEVFDRDAAAAAMDLIRRVVAGGESICTEQVREVGTERIWFLDEAFPVRDDDGKIIAVGRICHNITERKHTEESLMRFNHELERRVKERTAALEDANEELRRAAAERQRVEQDRLKLAAIVEHSNDLIGISDFSQRVLYLNDAGRALTGLGACAVRDTLLKDYLDTRGRIRLEQEMLPAVMSKGHWEGEVFLRHLQTHEMIPMHAHIFLIRSETDRTPLCLAGIMRDMRSYHALERQVLDAAEREQRRIGRNLHDNLGQQLTGISFLAKVLASQLAVRGLPEAGDAREITKLLSQAVEETRALSRGLSPIEMDAQGLVKALDELARSSTRLSGVSCRFTCRAPVLINDHVVAANLHSIAREAVNNALKHAGAATVEIELDAGPEGLSLSVMDDGRGIDPGRRDGGIGVSTMTYRARVCGGVLSICPGKPRGTVVQCAIPQNAAWRRGNREERGNSSQSAPQPPA